MTLVLGVLIVFGLVLALVPFGCAAPAPKTHEEWAQYCLGKSDKDFAACLKDWDKWSGTSK